MVQLDELRTGKRAKIRPVEFAQLRGCSTSTLSRERWEGSPIPFEKDERTGRVFYDAQDVLEYLDKPKFTHTSAYQHDGCHRMELARSAKCKRQQSS